MIGFSAAITASSSRPRAFQFDMTAWLTVAHIHSAAECARTHKGRAKARKRMRQERRPEGARGSASHSARERSLRQRRSASQSRARSERDRLQASTSLIHANGPAIGSRSSPRNISAETKLAPYASARPPSPSPSRSRMSISRTVQADAGSSIRSSAQTRKRGHGGM